MPTPRVSPVVALLALVAVRGTIYAVRGIDFVLDDRGFVARRILLGPAETGAEYRAGRPGAWLTYTVVYGIAGQHPVVLFVLVTFLNAAVVIALYVALCRFLSKSTAFLVSAVWVVIPNHNSLTVWGATTPTVVALGLFLVGVIACADRKWGWAAMLFAGSVLSYELFAPIAMAAILATVWSDRPERGSIARLGVPAFLAVIAATLWALGHPIYPLAVHFPNPLVFWDGHFGAGLFGSSSVSILLRLIPASAIAVGVIISSARWCRGSTGRDDGPGLVVAGGAVMVLGALVGLNRHLVTSGLGDRLYVASSVGAAMALVGLGQLLWRRRPALAVGAGIALVGVCITGQVVSLGSWSQAGSDGEALLHDLARRSEQPEDTDWVIGPEPLTRNGVLVMQSWDGTYALQLLYGRGAGSIRIAANPSEFRREHPTDQLVRWKDVAGVAR